MSARGDLPVGVEVAAAGPGVETSAEPDRRSGVRPDGEARLAAPAARRPARPTDDPQALARAALADPAAAGASPSVRAIRPRSAGNESTAARVARAQRMTGASR